MKRQKRSYFEIALLADQGAEDNDPRLFSIITSFIVIKYVDVNRIMLIPSNWAPVYMLHLSLVCRFGIFCKTSCNNDSTKITLRSNTGILLLM